MVSGSNPEDNMNINSPIVFNSVVEFAQGLVDAEGNELTDLSGTGGGGLTEEEVEDTVAALITEGENVTVTYDDANDTLTIAATDTDTQLSDEQVQDIVGAMVSDGNGITATYSDAAGTLTIAIPSDAIQADELDLSITPTWTGKHAFGGGVTLSGDSDVPDGVAVKYGSSSQTVTSEYDGANERLDWKNQAGTVMQRLRRADTFPQFPNGIDVLDSAVRNVATLNGADVANATSGHVMVSDGSGNLQMQAQSGDAQAVWGPGHYVDYETGLSTEQINKIYIEDGETITVTRMEAPIKATPFGNTEPGFTLEWYDNQSNLLNSVVGNELETGPWSYTNNTGGTVATAISVSNSSGSSQTVSPALHGSIA